MAKPHPALFDLASGRPLRVLPGDWEALVPSALEHRVSGLLESRVQAGEVEPPGRWRDLLRAQDVGAWGRNTLLLDALPRLVGRLADLGVSCAVAKGPPAELRWYGRPGERPSSDLDLFLHPGQVGRLAEVIGALQPDHPLAGSAQALADRGLLQTVELKVDGVPVDLHLDAFHLGLGLRRPEVVWSRAVPCALPNGATVPVLDAECSLVLLTVQLNRDHFAYLLAYVDVTRIVEREELDWGFIERFVAAEGLEVPFTKTMEAVDEVLGLPVPPARRGSGWRGMAWERIFPPSSRLLGREAALRHKHTGLWLPFLLRGRLPEALRWWLRSLVPPPSLLAYHHPEVEGPYLRRLLFGRLSTRLARLRVLLRLRQGSPGA